ncbi:MAG TPA: Wadjet anti-phage system protein JetD domain-containing protein [Steroidobacteraceae bacterium]|nr:Wadjet anti-phage system protein JetD domain-containing protein [Steroidobacteraceae bacterium]
MNEPAPPTWLAEEDEIRALLHEVLDRFDAQPGAERQKRLHLKAEQHLPSLQRGDATADQTWALIEHLVAMNVCTVSAARRSPYDPSWSGSKLAFEPAIEPVLREWLGRAFIEPSVQSWRHAIDTHAHEFPGDVQALLARRIALSGRSDEEVIAALARAGALRGPMSLRQLSATLFWGDSKVLDERGDLIAALFPQLQLRERPIVAAVHLALVPRGVLFIENQDTYALAASGALPSAEYLTLVYSAGFRGAAARIRGRAGSLLHFAGPGLDSTRMTFEQWWYAESAARIETSFWGDLDFAGMQILKALRLRFGDVRAWALGYEPMLRALRSRPSRHGDDRAQVDPVATGCTYADTVLLPAIRDCGYLDQEWVAIPER